MFEERSKVAFIKLKQHYFTKPASILEEEKYIYVSTDKITTMIWHPPVEDNGGYTELMVDRSPIFVVQTVEEIFEMMGAN